MNRTEAWINIIINNPAKKPPIITHCPDSAVASGLKISTYTIVAQTLFPHWVESE